MKKYLSILIAAAFALLSTANIIAADGNTGGYTQTNYPQQAAPVQPGYVPPGGGYGGSGGYQTNSYYNAAPPQQNYAPPPAYNTAYPSYYSPGVYAPGVLAPMTPDQLNPGASEANRLYDSYKYLPQ